MEFLLTVMPMEKFPGQLCVYFELMMALTAVNRHMGSVIVAVGRYVTISCLTGEFVKQFYFGGIYIYVHAPMCVCTCDRDCDRGRGKKKSEPLNYP